MIKPIRPIAAAIALTALGACTSTYTGPVEVTRFVAASPVGLGQGNIAIAFPDEMTNLQARSAFAAAVSAELAALGYTVVAEPGAAGQTAAIRTSRGEISRAATGGRGPVSVGVGGGTGSYGSGVGVGLGINLGGGKRGAEIVSDLSVRIASAEGATLWEGRAQLPTSVNSPYAEVDASAQALAAALFRDFPGGNGETVQVSVEDLERTP